MWALSIAIAASDKLHNEFPVTGVMSRFAKDFCGEDSFCIHETQRHYILSVADGVGGWRHRGIDPSAFSRNLMNQVVGSSESLESRPIPDMSSERLIRSAFKRLIASYISGEEEPFGASTIAVAVLDKYSGWLDVANLGDSQVLVMRNGKVVLKTAQQQRSFNAPVQLSLDQEGRPRGNPKEAEHQRLRLAQNDLIIVATDGLHDNLSLPDIEGLCRETMFGCGEPGKWKEDALAIRLVETARQVSLRTDVETPFSIKSAEHNHRHIGG